VTTTLRRPRVKAGRAESREFPPGGLEPGRPSARAGAARQLRPV